MTSITYKTGRPRKAGDRYPGGKLKPQSQIPNQKVIALRRAMLGAKDGDAVDLSKAENPMDLAFERGWVTERRHRAGQLFANLYRGIRMPTLKVSRDTSDFATSAPSPVDRYFQAEEGLEVSGVVLPIDLELGDTINKALEDLNAGRITQQQYGSILAKADKKHRASKINWANLPASDVARLFDKVMSASGSGGPTGGRQGIEIAMSEGEPLILPVIPEMLREIWAMLKSEETSELFSVCCLGRWPEWIVQRIQGGVLEAPVYRRRRKLLEAGLDKIAEHSQARSKRPAVTIPQPPRPEGVSIALSPAPAEAARLVDRTVYVDQDGGKLFEVEQVRRARHSR